jgi:oxygen-dependent protoporphyrinogen oxidase
MNPINVDVIVIGGGISGLACASTLKKRGISFLLLESNDALGGVIRSERLDGFLCESGPNTISVSKEEALQFLESAGLLGSALDAAPHAKNRFILQEGELRPLPNSILGFMRTNVLSRKGKVRLLKDLFIAKSEDPNETIADFFRRRLGDEVFLEFIEPFVSGIYAGDPNQLLVRHTFPTIYDLEQRYGGLLAGLLFSKKKKPARLISWPGGLQEFVEGISKSFSDQIHLSTSVEKIVKHEQNFSIETNRGNFECKKVVVATSSPRAAVILKNLSTEAAALETVPYAPICVVHLGFKREDVDHLLNGFGVLINRMRKIRTLGCLFSSTLFPGRAPDEHVLLTVFIGGRWDPAILNLNDPQLIELILKELDPLLLIKSEPCFQNVIRWSRAIPQYEKEHDRILQLCEALERDISGLYLLGSYRGGVSVQDCIIHGCDVAEKISTGVKK